MLYVTPCVSSIIQVKRRDTCIWKQHSDHSRTKGDANLEKEEDEREQV